MFTQTDYNQLQQIMEESPEKEELLTRLLAAHRMEIRTLSHEIRNPLTLIYSTLQLIEAQHPEVRSYRHWDALHQDIEYVKQLLEELSSYHNSERLSLSRLNTVDFLKALVLSFAASAAEADMEFTSQIDPLLPDISADPLQLKELLLNLLRNAQDSACSAEKLPAVSLRAFTEENHIHIAVTDNGSGILPADIEKIFEPFITYKKDGTGLGLPIARRIAHAHGGTLTVVSDPDTVTTFTLTLPIQ